MSSLDEPVEPLTTRQGTELRHRFIEPPEKRWQSAWNWLSEKANPIVVKEARQSLNSRQFTLSFGLTLTAIVLWTLFAVMSQLPEIYYIPGGLRMLSGYLVILAFPLLLVIPFSAFRSMVIEAEERTFELVSISALSATKIVHGKMFSACLQMTIYLSALTPCIVVTYLLRGVSLVTLINYLSWTVLISITLTALSILGATAGRARLLQVFSSIFVLGLLLIVCLIWSYTAMMSLSESTFELKGSHSTILMFALSTMVASVVPVCLRCAAAAIDFPSENHAFSIRMGLLFASAVVSCWVLWFTIYTEEYRFGVTFLFFLLFVYLMIGSLVVSDRGIISPRAQRSLPRTWMGRLFLTWFYPGAGLGYIFLSCLVASLALPWFLLGIFATNFQMGIQHSTTLTGMGLAVGCYFVFYTGLTRMILLTIPRNKPGRTLIAFSIQVLLVACGALIPFTSMLIARRFQVFNYSWHHGLNVFWTMSDLAYNEISGDNGIVLAGLPLLALLLFAMNLLLCSRDVLLVRAELPPRVREEIERNAEPAPPPPDPFA